MSTWEVVGAVIVSAMLAPFGLYLAARVVFLAWFATARKFAIRSNKDG